jgi:hypothetical protein
MTRTRGPPVDILIRPKLLQFALLLDQLLATSRSTDTHNTRSEESRSRDNDETREEKCQKLFNQLKDISLSMAIDLWADLVRNVWERSPHKYKG